MHTIIAADCTGCELCLAPCPVECIKMQVVPTTTKNWKWSFPAAENKKYIPIKPI